jgi:molybdate transport system ATP-binding protein
VHGPTLVAIEPASVAVHRTRPEGSPRNVWQLTVADVDRHADRVRLTLAGQLSLVAEITPAAFDDLALRSGDPVWAAVKATEIVTYPA